MISESEMLSLGFTRPAGENLYRREFAHNVSLIATSTSNGIHIQIQVLNEFVGPYYKDELVSIDLTTSDLADSIRLAGSIRRVTVENTII